MNPLKDLHFLDTYSNTWISPSVRGEGPEAREGHGAAVIGKRLFIFGGCRKDPSNCDEEFYDDLYILNTGGRASSSCSHKVDCHLSLRIFLLTRNNSRMEAKCLGF